MRAERPDASGCPGALRRAPSPFCRCPEGAWSHPTGLLFFLPSRRSFAFKAKTPPRVRVGKSRPREFHVCGGSSSRALGRGRFRGPEKDAVAEPRCLPGESSTRCAGADRRGGKGAGSFQSWLRHLGVCPSGLGVCYAAPLTLLASCSACPIPRAPALPPGRCGGPREAPRPSARPSARPNPLGSEDPDLRPGVVSGCGASVLQNRGIRVSG